MEVMSDDDGYISSDYTDVQFSEDDMKNDSVFLRRKRKTKKKRSKDGEKQEEKGEMELEDIEENAKVSLFNAFIFIYSFPPENF